MKYSNSLQHSMGIKESITGKYNHTQISQGYITYTVLAIGITINKGWYRSTSLERCPDSDKMKHNK